MAVSGDDVVEVFDVPPVVNATISGLTVENGDASGGGGIHNNGTLNLTGSTVSDNSAAKKLSFVYRRHR